MKIYDTINDSEAREIVRSDEYRLYLKALCWIASEYVSRIRVQFAEKAFEMYKNETVRMIVLAYGVEHDKLESSRLQDFKYASEYGAATPEALNDSCLNEASSYAHTIKMLFGIK